jgi:hypothetical protein
MVRICFNEECYGFRHGDGSFEPVAMPLEWKPPDLRGMQIELSRHRIGYHGASEYMVGGGISSSEKMAPVSRSINARKLEVE